MIQKVAKPYECLNVCARRQGFYDMKTILVIKIVGCAFLCTKKVIINARHSLLWHFSYASANKRFRFKGVASIFSMGFHILNTSKWTLFIHFYAFYEEKTVNFVHFRHTKMIFFALYCVFMTLETFGFVRAFHLRGKRAMKYHTYTHIISYVDFLSKEAWIFHVPFCFFLSLCVFSHWMHFRVHAFGSIHFALRSLFYVQNVHIKSTSKNTMENYSATQKVQNERKN